MSSTNQPKCVVTGGAGFIGSHLVEVLVEDGWDVTVLDTRQPPTTVNWLALDIRNDLGDSLTGFDFIFHLAAISNARKCSEDPGQCIALNVAGTLNLLKAAQRAKVKRFVLASSAWIAGTQVGELIDENSLFDLSRLNTLYGCSKLTQENLCIAYKSEYGGPDYTILRYGTPFGERMWKGLVVRAFLEMASSYGVIHIMGDGKQAREFLYVKDLCNAHKSLVDEKAANKIYYLTGDSPVSIESIAQEVIKYYPARIEYVPQARIEPRLSTISNALAKRDLGWQIETQLPAGIKRCFEWWNGLSEKEKSYGYWC